MTRDWIIVHSLQDACDALAAASELKVPVGLRSAPGAAAYLGPQVFRAMIDAARLEYPEVDAVAVLDCGADPGHTLAALRAGIDCVRVRLPAEVRARVADIARQCAATLDDDQRPALDLLDCETPREACRAWLSGHETRRSGG